MGGRRDLDLLKISLDMKQARHSQADVLPRTSYEGYVPPTLTRSATEQEFHCPPNSAGFGLRSSQHSHWENATMTPAIRLWGMTDAFLSGKDYIWTDILAEPNQLYLASFHHLYGVYREVHPGDCDPLEIHRLILLGHRVAILQYLRWRTILFPDERETLDTMKWSSRGEGSEVRVRVSQVHLGQEYMHTVAARTNSQNWGHKPSLNRAIDRQALLISRLVIDIWLEQVGEE
jgi:hypothetical protein